MTHQGSDVFLFRGRLVEAERFEDRVHLLKKLREDILGPNFATTVILRDVIRMLRLIVKFPVFLILKTGQATFWNYLLNHVYNT